MANFHKQNEGRRNRNKTYIKTSRINHRKITEMILSVINSFTREDFD